MFCAFEGFYFIIVFITLGIFNSLKNKVHLLYFVNLFGAGLGTLAFPFVHAFNGISGVLFLILAILTISGLLVSLCRFRKLIIVPVVFFLILHRSQSVYEQMFLFRSTGIQNSAKWVGQAQK